MTESLCECVPSARLSMAYSEVVQQATTLHDPSWWVGNPLGPRVAIQIPEASWQKLMDAICDITGADRV